MNQMIFNYIENLFADRVQNEALRREKEVVYACMDRAFNNLKNEGKTDEEAFSAAVEKSAEFIKNYESTHPGYGAGAGSNENRVYDKKRPYSSSVLKAIAVSMLILSIVPMMLVLLFALGFGFQLLASLSMFGMIILGVGLLVFDSQRIKYPGCVGSAALMALAVMLYVLGGFFLGSLICIPIVAVGVVLNVLARRNIKEYKKNGGEVVMRAKNRLGWLIMLICCVISSVVLYSTALLLGTALTENPEKYQDEYWYSEFEDEYDDYYDDYEF